MRPAEQCKLRTNDHDNQEKQNDEQPDSCSTVHLVDVRQMKGCKEELRRIL